MAEWPVVGEVYESRHVPIVWRRVTGVFGGRVHYDFDYDKWFIAGLRTSASLRDFAFSVKDAPEIPEVIPALVAALNAYLEDGADIAACNEQARKALALVEEK